MRLFSSFLSEYVKQSSFIKYDISISYKSASFFFFYTFQLISVLPIICHHYTVKFANFASPFKFFQVYSPQKLVLTLVENEKMCFSVTVSIVSSFSLLKVISSFSRPVFCGNLTWRNLKGRAELANLTVCKSSFCLEKQNTLQTTWFEIRNRK